MKKSLMVTLTLMLLIITSDLFAQLKFSGDSRFRPRYNIDDRTENGGTLTNDAYVLYRLRMNFNWNIGDGFFLQSRLGHNGLAGYGRFGAGQSADALGNYNTDFAESGKRMSLDIMLLNGGRSTETYGYKMGLFSVGSYANPIYDVHYFASFMIDIPFFTLNNDGLMGASAYYKAGPGKVTVSALYDNPLGKSVEDADGNELYNQNDNYSFYADYNVKVAGWSVQPMVIMTLADSASAPLTLGANITSPKLVGDLALGLTAIYSINSVKSEDIVYSDFGKVNNEYNAYLLRAKISGKIGPGKLLFWADLGNRVDMFETKDDVNNDFFYTWLAYTFTVYSGDNGQFSITPEWRHVVKSEDDVNIQTREMIEVNFDFKF